MGKLPSYSAYSKRSDLVLACRKLNLPVTGRKKEDLIKQLQNYHFKKEKISNIDNNVLETLQIGDELCAIEKRFPDGIDPGVIIIDQCIVDGTRTSEEAISMPKIVNCLENDHKQFLKFLRANGEKVNIQEDERRKTPKQIKKKRFKTLLVDKVKKIKKVDKINTPKKASSFFAWGSFESTSGTPETVRFLSRG